MSIPACHRGAATLAVTLLLLVAVSLAALYAQKRHVAELRADASQSRARQAFEAAEAGLAWATARLDEPGPLDADCRPAAAGASFRDRHLSVDAASGRVLALTTDVNGVPVARRAACVRAGTEWHCRCAGDTDPRPSTGPHEPSAAFVVRFTTSGSPGRVQLDAIGCARLPCAETGDGAGPWMRLDVLLGLLPGLAQPPLAPLTVRGDVDAGTAAIGLHNADPAAGGIAVHAGGDVRAPQARWSGPPGAPSAARVERDGTLGASGAESLFVSLFGLDKARWRARAAVAAVPCSGPCNAPLAQALVMHRAAYVDGDLELDGALALGTPQRPVIVVARGDVRLRGAVSIHGVLYGGNVAWEAAPTGALLHGALVSEGDYRGDAAPDLVYDAAVLTALRDSGSYAPLPGGWRDFR